MYPAEMQLPPNVQVVEHVAPADHPALYSSSRLTLNLTRGGMARYGFCPSGRFFEAAACGTPLVSDYFPGLDSFFVPGEELFLVEDGRDVLDAMSSSDEELSRMAERARQRTLDEHTGERRARELLRFFDEASRGHRPVRTASKNINLPDGEPAAKPSCLTGGVS
jgi:spore maturation protein CgeB